jgi:hypothetical protein
MMRKMPIGIQTFETIITDGYVYVDKTEWVYRLANEGKFFFLGRPRRFGKSLFLSTLKSYFEGKKELFQGLAMEGLEKEWIQYPVLHIDLNVQNYKDLASLEAGLDTNLRYLEKTWELDGQNNGNKTPATRGRRFKFILFRPAAVRQTGLRRNLAARTDSRGLYPVHCPTAFFPRLGSSGH